MRKRQLSRRRHLARATRRRAGSRSSDAQAGRAAGGDRCAGSRSSIATAGGEHGRLLDAIEASSSAARAAHPDQSRGRPRAHCWRISASIRWLIGGLGALSYGMALLAHIVEEVREGVPLRIIPDALGAHYAGPDDRSLPEERKRRRDDPPLLALSRRAPRGAGPIASPWSTASGGAPIASSTSARRGWLVLWSAWASSRASAWRSSRRTGSSTSRP